MPGRKRSKRVRRRRMQGCVLDYEFCQATTLANGSLTNSFTWGVLGVDASRPVRPLAVSLDLVCGTEGVLALEVYLYGPPVGTDTGAIVARSHVVAVGMSSKRVRVNLPRQIDFFTPATNNPVFGIRVGDSVAGGANIGKNNTLMITGTVSVQFIRSSALITLKQPATSGEDSDAPSSFVCIREGLLSGHISPSNERLSLMCPKCE